MAQDNFQRAFDKLNEKQKEAVSTIDGPVLTLAGPGTGKTQVLTLRIAQILKSTQMNPSNILCLTFTEAGAKEMQQRLKSFIGNDSYDVKITTFHGFANSIIQEFSHKFGDFIVDEDNIDNEESNLLNDLSQIDDLDRLQIINRLLDDNKWVHIKPLRKPLHYLKDLSGIIKTIKLERIKPEELKQECLELIEEENSKETKPSQTLLNQLNRTIELAEFFKLYQREIQLNQNYDYEDMINWVVDTLGNDTELALIYQEKYQYILVDEYQDTNNAQLELLKRLTSHFSDNPNLFVVGDPNQSIYRFQGASTKNIHDFIRLYPNAKKINLINNYRSPQVVLDTAHNLISHNLDAQDFFNEKLISATGREGEITLTRYLHSDQEEALIADKIVQLIKNGVKANSIAILIKENSQIDPFIRVLNERNIPSQVSRSETVLGNPIIEKVLTLLELVLEPYNKYIFGKTMFTLRGIISLSDSYYLNKLGPEKSFRLINNPALTEDHKISPRAIKLIKEIAKLSEEISLLPTAIVIEKIIQEFKIIKEISLLPNRVATLEALRSLVDDAKKNNENNIERWLIRIRSRKAYELDLFAKPILHGSDESVIIQTIHQSKGREYDYVFIPKLINKVWSKRISSKFYIPQLSQDKELIQTDEIAEQRRVLYVAITRTIKSCFLSVSQVDGKDELLESRFLEELGDKIKQAEVEETIKNAITRAEASIEPIDPINPNDKEIAWLKEIVAQKPLTPTGYGSYKKCPKNYLITNILRIPSVKSASLSYGTAIHFALEKYFREFQKSGIKPPLRDLLIGFEIDFKKEIMTDQDREVWLAAGRELLTAYYSKNEEQFVAPVKTEYDFPVTYFGEIPIKGKIDKIEWIDPKEKTVRVIDYKTGNSKSRNALLGLTKNPDTTYLDQLKFYHLLGSVDTHFKFNWKIAESQLEFLDNKHRFTKEAFTFTQEEMNIFKKDIQAVWQKIQNLEFDHEDNNPYGCEYCGIINIGKNK